MKKENIFKRNSQEAKKPEFYCSNWINEQGYLKKYRTKECKEQCHKCMDVIIDHHFNKKTK